MEAPAATSACLKCRSHRVKCNRLKPVCGRCEKLNHSCVYPVKNTAVAYLRYVQGLETDIARLEQELEELDQYNNQSDGSPAVDSTHSQQQRDISSSPPISAPDQLIQDLFADPIVGGTSGDDEKVQDIVDHWVQVTLSIITFQQSAVTQDRALRALILGAARSVDRSGPSKSNYLLTLPAFTVSQKVMGKYCDDVLPLLPFHRPSDVQHHLCRAFQDQDPYSVFITATCLATTAISISPDCLEKAALLYETGVAALEASFVVQQEDEPIRALEAVISLGQFAHLSGDHYADAWTLSGIAIRIAIDLGLHKVCDTDRKRRLFWSAYTLDQNVARSRGLPPGIPDGVIESPLPTSCHPFVSYRTSSHEDQSST